MWPFAAPSSMYGASALQQMLWVWLTASLMAFLPTVMAMQNNQATVAHVAQGAAAAIGAGLVAAAVPAALNRSRLIISSTYRRIAPERRVLWGGQLQARARAMCFVRMRSWLPSLAAGNKRLDWKSLEQMPEDPPLDLQNQLGGDAELVAQEWQTVRGSLFDSKLRQGWICFLHLVARGMDPLLATGDQLQTYLEEYCKDKAQGTVKQVTSQLAHVFDAVGRNLPDGTVNQTVNMQQWPTGVAPFALTHQLRVDPLNPVTEKVKLMVKAAAKEAAKQREKQQEEGGDAAAAAAAQAQRKVAMSAAAIAVEFIACLGKGVDYFMRLTRPAAGARISSRHSMQPQPPEQQQNKLPVTPIMSKSQTRNALCYALLHLLRISDVPRPRNAAAHMRHADLFVYFGTTRVHLLTLCFLKSEVTAELLGNHRPAKLVTGMWFGKRKKSTLYRQRDTMPACYNLLDMLDVYTLCVRLLLELNSGDLFAASAAAEDEQNATTSRSSSPEGDEEEDEEELVTGVDAQKLLQEALLALGVSPEAAASAAAAAAAADTPSAAAAGSAQLPEAMVMGTDFDASKASRSTHGPAAARQGLYVSRRAAAQELVFHNVPAAVIRLLMGHGYNSDMFKHYASNNHYVTGSDGTTQLVLASDLGGPVMRIGESLTLSVLPPGAAHSQGTITADQLILEDALPAHLAEEVAPVAELVRQALDGPDASTRLSAAAQLQELMQQQMAGDRAALASDSLHATWVQRACMINVDCVDINADLIRPLEGLQEAVAQGKSLIRRWLGASPVLLSGSSSSSSSSSSASIPRLVVSSYVPFILGRWSLFHAHMRDSSGQPSPALQALLDACGAQQAPGTSPADAAIERQQQGLDPQVVVHTTNITVGAPFNQGSGGRGACRRMPAGADQDAPPPAAAARIYQARDDFEDALRQLATLDADMDEPMFVWEFVELAGNADADRSELLQAADSLLRMARAEGQSAVVEAVRRVMAGRMRVLREEGWLQKDQEMVLPFVAASEQQRAAAELRRLQAAAAAEAVEHARQQNRLLTRERRALLGFQEVTIREMRGGPAAGAGGARGGAGVGAAGGRRRRREDSALPSTASASDVEPQLQRLRLMEQAEAEADEEDHAMEVEAAAGHEQPQQQQQQADEVDVDQQQDWDMMQDLVLVQQDDKEWEEERADWVMVPTAAPAAAGGRGAQENEEQDEDYDYTQEDDGNWTDPPEDCEDDRPGVWVWRARERPPLPEDDRLWFVQRGDHAIMPVFGKDAKDKMTLKVPMADGSEASVWLFRMERFIQGNQHVMLVKRYFNDQQDIRLPLKMCSKTTTLHHNLVRVVHTLMPDEPGVMTEVLQQLEDSVVDEVAETMSRMVTPV